MGVKGIAPDKSPLQVSLIEFLADSQNRSPLIKTDLIIKPGIDIMSGVRHNIFPHQSAAVSQASGMPGCGRIKQQPGSFYHKSRNNHHPGFLMIGLPIMDKFDPCYPFPVPVSQHPCHHAVCQDFRSIAYGPGDMMYQGAVLGVRHTSLVAEAPVDAGGPAVKGGGEYGQGSYNAFYAKLFAAPPEDLRVGAYGIPFGIGIRSVK